ncbi:MAG: response regulator [Calditrichaceae bacterium]|nr:response regulator [Calditrichaceae bacterium]MBN2709023.1 response regulator [Calditrichaceae bacterium]
MPRILLADDNEEMLDTLERIFAFYDFEVLKAVNGKEAIEIANKNNPDIILLDGMMPVMDGFEACKILKSKKKTKDIPIVFLTANYTLEKHRITGLELGADDYLLKPFNSKELVARSKAILKRNELLRKLKSENENLTHKNEEMEQEIRSLVDRSKTTGLNELIDHLTGLYSYPFFEKRLKEEYERAVRHSLPLSMVMVHIHNLSKINDKFGYQTGNYIIIKLANNLITKTRVSDILARSENNRFYVLLPQTDEHGAYLEAERIRITLSDTDYLSKEFMDDARINRRKGGELNKIEVNLGVATYMPDPEADDKNTEADLLNNTTAALKRSILMGRNKTYVYQSEQ